MVNTILVDGTLDFLGGQDASKEPFRVPEDAVFAAVNVSMRNGSLNPRPAFAKKNITFPPGGVTTGPLTVKTYEDIYLSGRWQMAAPYTIGTANYLVVVVSGIIYLLNQDSLVMQILPIKGGSTLNEAKFRLNFANAGRYLVIFDYPSYPVIIEGTSARRSDPAKDEVPISVLGAFNESRLFIGNAGQEFTGGDPVGNTITPDAPITFAEVLEPSSPYVAQVFSINTQYNNDPITAMALLPTSDTSTGIGPLLIATKKGIWSYNTQNPRSTWQQGGFGSSFVYEAGIAGPQAFSAVGSDLFFLSQDGELRSASMARDEQRKWSKVPISKEVKNWLKFWDKDLVEFAAVAYFNNKILVTCNPYRVASRDTQNNPITDFTHGGLVVIELDNISTLGQAGKPSWAGLWTGVRPQGIVTTDSRCFIFAKDETFQNTIYEIDPNITADYADGKWRDIESTVYTKSYDFKDPFKNKTAHSLDLMVGNVRGDFKLKVEFKPTHAETFALWREFSHHAPFEQCCANPSCVTGLAPHSLQPIILGSPIDAEKCEPVGQMRYGTFKEVQLRLKIKGRSWRLDKLKVKATDMVQTESGAYCSSPFNEVPVCGDCSTDWRVERFNQC